LHASTDNKLKNTAQPPIVLIGFTATAYNKAIVDCLAEASAAASISIGA
jgi:hypothetical protein